MYGLSGASRSGKTTLAKAISIGLEIPYVDSSTTAIMARHGYNPVAPLILSERIVAQKILLKAYIEMMQEQPRIFITDRTPMDMLGYALGEITMHNTPPELGDIFHEYAIDCIKATEDIFALVFLVEPLSSYAVDPTKPPPNKAYHKMHQFLIAGALHSSNTRWYTVPEMSVDERMMAVVVQIKNEIERHQTAREGALCH